MIFDENRGKKFKDTNSINLGYNLDIWRKSGLKLPVTTDISPATNSHFLICGMSGSGKSYYENWLFSNLISANSDGEFYFSDYKGDDSFAHLKKCINYKSYRNSLENLDIVYAKLNERLAGSKERNSVTLIFDEYMACILSLQNEDKKRATEVMNKVSEILLMGRSVGVRLITSMQRADSMAFVAGAKLNYGNIVILGGSVKSINEMLIPDHIGKVEGVQFGRGEGIILMQNSILKFVKCPTINEKSMKKIHKLCIKALS